MEYDDGKMCKDKGEDGFVELIDMFCDPFRQNLLANIIAQNLCAEKNKKEINLILHFLHILTASIKSYL